MSIIDKKYAERYKNKPTSWFDSFIDGQVQDKVTKEKTVKAEDGTETTETVTLKKTVLNLDSLFGLAKANSIDTASMEAQRDQKNAPGRIRMTLGNQLRAAAKRRHGLFDVDGSWNDADAEFLGDAEKTEERDGTKIVKAKPAAAAATEQSTETA